MKRRNHQNSPEKVQGNPDELGGEMAVPADTHNTLERLEGEENKCIVKTNVSY